MLKKLLMTGIFISILLAVSGCTDINPGDQNALFKESEEASSEITLTESPTSTTSPYTSFSNETSPESEFVLEPTILSKTPDNLKNPVENDDHTSDSESVLFEKQEVGYADVINDILVLQSTINDYQENNDGEEISLPEYLKTTQWYEQYTQGHGEDEVNEILRVISYTWVKNEPLQSVSYTMLLSRLYPELGITYLEGAPIHTAKELIPQVAILYSGDQVKKFPAEYVGEIVHTANNIPLSYYESGDIYLIIKGNSCHTGMILAKIETEDGNTELLASDSNRDKDGQVETFWITEDNVAGILDTKRYIIRKYREEYSFITEDIKKVYMDPVTYGEIEFLTNHEVCSGDINRNIVIMTYDDGGKEEDLNHIMDTYEKYGLRTTFFVTGEWVENNRELTKSIIDRGFEIGCHGWYHSDMTSLSSTEIHKRLADFLSIMKEISPQYKITLIRFPYGCRNDRTRRIAAEFGLQSVVWNTESGGIDETTLTNVLDNMGPGSLVLSHSTRPYDVLFTEELLTSILAQGYDIVTVTEGMAKEDCFQEK